MTYDNQQRDVRGFGFPPAFFLSMPNEEAPPVVREQPTVDVVRIHRNLSLAVISMAMVAMVVVLL